MPRIQQRFYSLLNNRSKADPISIRWESVRGEYSRPNLIQVVLALRWRLTISVNNTEWEVRKPDRYESFRITEAQCCYLVRKATKSLVEMGRHKWKLKHAALRVDLWLWGAG